MYCGFGWYHTEYFVIDLLVVRKSSNLVEGDLKLVIEFNKYHHQNSSYSF
jgi:hypothetical protein